MRPPFFKRLHVRLTALPFLFVVLILAAGGAAFYWLDYSQVLKDYYKLYLVNITSEKKLAADSWVEFYKNDITNLSETPAVKEASRVMNAAFDKLPPLKRRKADQERQNISADLSAMLAGKVASGRYRMLAVISKDGRVFAGSKQEAVGADWSDRDFYKGISAVKKSPAFLRISSEGGNSAELVSVFQADNNTVDGIIYAVADAKELVSIMKIEKGVYRTGKVELIDGEGNVILSRDGVPSAKIKYNVPAAQKDEPVRQKAGTFFYCASLEDGQFRLIGTVEEVEAKAPINFLFALYCSCALLIAVVLIIQAAYTAPRLVSKPVAELTTYVNAASSGESGLYLDLKYKGELAELRIAFEDAVSYFTEREKLLSNDYKVPDKEEEKKPAEKHVSASSISEVCIYKEIKEPLARIASDIESAISAGAAPNAELQNIAEDANRLLVAADDLIALARFGNGISGSSSSEFEPAKELKKVEDEISRLIGSKEIVLVVDCENSVPQSLKMDKDSIYYMVKALATEAVLNTDIGTITITAGIATENDTRYLRFAVADTGRGFSKELLDQMLDTDKYMPGCFTNWVVKATAQSLGGRMEVESIEGKGSVFTVFIPFESAV
ncbi:MAG: hypothetical protein HQL10_05910 [Nitrospirae bacterium]|nr:hypothetical protein [Nitrospirota bacterium]